MRQPSLRALRSFTSDLRLAVDTAGYLIWPASRRSLPTRTFPAARRPVDELFAETPGGSNESAVLAVQGGSGRWQYFTGENYCYSRVGSYSAPSFFAMRACRRPRWAFSSFRGLIILKPPIAWLPLTSACLCIVTFRLGAVASWQLILLILCVLNRNGLSFHRGSR